MEDDLKKNGRQPQIIFFKYKTTSKNNRRQPQAQLKKNQH